MRRLLAIACSLWLGGCGDRLVDEAFLGDAAIRFHGVLTAPVARPGDATVGAIWLGFSGLSQPSSGVETRTLPISAIEFPSNFTCDLLDTPPGTGYYQTARGVIIPSSLRIARLFVFDDADRDGRFALDGKGLLVPPDRLLARSMRHALIFVSAAPADPQSYDGRGMILTNWEQALPGYHLVALDPAVASPDLSGTVVGNETPVAFELPLSEVNF